MGYTKEQILGTDIVNKSLQAATVESIVKYAATKLDNISELPTPSASNVGQTYVIKGVQYDCEETDRGVYEWVAYDKAGQVIDYQDASNKPKFNGVTLAGDQVPETYGLAKSDTQRDVLASLTGSEYIPLDTDEKIDVDTLGTYVVDNFVDAYLTNNITESATYSIQYSDNNITNVIVNTVNSSVTIDLIGDTATVLNKNNQIFFKNTYGDMNVEIKIDGVGLYPIITVNEDRSLFIEFTVILVNRNKILVIKNIQNPAAF